MRVLRLTIGTLVRLGEEGVRGGSREYRDRVMRLFITHPPSDPPVCMTENNSPP